MVTHLNKLNLSVVRAPDSETLILGDDPVCFTVLADGDYRPLPADDAGVVRSRVFPGLRLALAALLNGDLAGALRQLQEGIDSAEHRQFVARIAAKA